MSSVSKNIIKVALCKHLLVSQACKYYPPLKKLVLHPMNSLIHEKQVFKNSIRLSQNKLCKYRVHSICFSKINLLQYTSFRILFYFILFLFSFVYISEIRPILKRLLKSIYREEKLLSFSMFFNICQSIKMYQL